MNEWQAVYCNEFFEGKEPRGNLNEYNMLGQVKSKVIVHFPDFNGINGFKPAHIETYTVTESDCDMPNGKISVPVLAGNLSLWTARGIKVETR